MVDCSNLSFGRCLEAYVAAYPDFSASVTIGLATLVSAIVAYIAATLPARSSRKTAEKEAEERGRALIKEGIERASLHFGIARALLQSNSIDTWTISQRTLMLNRLAFAEQETLGFCRRAWAMTDKVGTSTIHILSHHLIRLEGITSLDRTIINLLNDRSHYVEIGPERLSQMIDATSDEIVRLSVQVDPNLPHQSTQRRRREVLKEA